MTIRLESEAWPSQIFKSSNLLPEPDGECNLLQLETLSASRASGTRSIVTLYSPASARACSPPVLSLPFQPHGQLYGWHLATVRF